jgi:hypothetical protein
MSKSHMSWVLYTEPRTKCMHASATMVLCVYSRDCCHLVGSLNLLTGLLIMQCLFHIKSFLEEVLLQRGVLSI